MPQGDNMKRSAVTAYRNGGKAHKNSRHSRSAWNTNGMLKPRESERIALVVKFDSLYQRFGHNPRAMFYLAEWADRHSLTLAHHARAAAKGWQPCTKPG